MSLLTFNIRVQREGGGGEDVVDAEFTHLRKNSRVGFVLGHQRQESAPNYVSGQIGRDIPLRPTGVAEPRRTPTRRPTRTTPRSTLNAWLCCPPRHTTRQSSTCADGG